MAASSKDLIHNLEMNAICRADHWYEDLPIQEQFNARELAARVMSQGIVMRLEGDHRRGLDMFPDAWKAVVLGKAKEVG